MIRTTHANMFNVLLGLVSTSASVDHDRLVYRQGSASMHVYLLLEGWAASSVVSADGARQIIKAYMPGDLIGLHNVGRSVNFDGVHALTCDVRVGAIDPLALFDAMRDQPALAHHLFMMLQDEKLWLMERLASVGRTSAKSRIANLMLHFARRLSPGFELSTTELHVPLTQEEIGDMTGLTGVHVNRMLRNLRDEGIANWKGSVLTIFDARALKHNTNFDPAPPHDFGWLSVLPTPGLALKLQAQ